MSGVCFLQFLKVIFLLSPFEKLGHSLFYLSILFITFFSSSMFQMHLRPWIHLIEHVVLFYIFNLLELNFDEVQKYIELKIWRTGGNFGFKTTEDKL